MKTTNQKPGVMFYFSQWDAPIELLSGEQVKELLRAVLNLAEKGEYPDSFSDKAVKVFFNQMERAILHDDEQYQKKIAQRKKAAQASVNARQRSLTSVNECQRMSTNTIQSNTDQYNSIQSNSIQSNTEQYSSTQTKEKYWGDNTLWEERCAHYGVDPYDQKEREEFERSWCLKDDDNDTVAF